MDFITRMGRAWHPSRAWQVWPELPGPTKADDFYTGTLDQWDAKTPLLLAIEYQDFNGEITRRKVLVAELVIQDSHYYIAGLCYSRRDMRNFRIDRIREAINAATGEVLDGPMRYFGAILAPHVEAQRAKQAKEEEQKAEATQNYFAARNYLRDEIYVLMHIALIDGEFSAAERTVVGEYIQGRLPDYGIDLSPRRQEDLLIWASALTPSRRTALTSVSRVRDDERFARLGKAIIDLVQADGPANAAETEAVQALISRVKRDRARSS